MSAFMESRVWKFMKRILSLLSSPEALFWSIGSWVTYYTFMMIWDKESFAHFVNGLADRTIMQVPYLLFLLTGYLNLFRSSKKCLKTNIWKLAGTKLLPFGILLVFTGAFISISSRQFQWINAMPGDEIRPRWAQEQYRVESVDAGVRDRLLDIDSEGESGIFKYEPKVTISQSGQAARSIGAFPPSRVGNTFYHVLNFGMAPSFAISEGGVLKGREYVPLRLLMPGSNDSFEIQPLPYKFLVSFEPDRTIQKGSVKAGEYNMKDPLLRIRVLEGQDVVAEEVTRESMSFRNIRLDVGKPVYWVQLEAVKDRGVYLIVSGLLFTCLGLPLYVISICMNLLRRQD